MDNNKNIKVVFQIDLTSSMGIHLQICKENIKICIGNLEVNYQKYKNRICYYWI